jgi:hypothetical protein
MGWFRFEPTKRRIREGRELPRRGERITDAEAGERTWQKERNEISRLARHVPATIARREHPEPPVGEIRCLNRPRECFQTGLSF